MESNVTGIPVRGLHLLIGRAGSGKTAYLTECLKEHIRRGERALLIVPEQHTFDGERRVAEAAGGLIGVQVLSMERLAERTLSQSGDRRTYLSRRGVCLAIRRSAYRRRDELKTFARALTREKGFTSEMAQLIAALKQAGISPDMLRDASERLKDKKLLSDKLHDVALVYGDLNELMGDRFLTVDDALNVAMEKLPNSFAKGIPVYIDGIPAATEQMFRAIGMLMRTASSVTVALTLDGYPSRSDIFTPNVIAYERLCDMARANGMDIFVREAAGRREQAPALAFLKEHLFDTDGKARYEGTDGDAVTLCEAPGVRAEVGALCGSVFGMLREGIPLSDMEVIVTDPERYLPVMETVCASYGIPVFMDTRRPLTGHAAARLMLGAVEAVAGGYRAEDVLAVLKSGYAGIDTGDAEIFENYVLRTRTRHQMFMRPIKKDDDAERLERIRAALMDPLAALGKGLEAPRVADKVRALSAYLDALGVKETLARQAEELERDGQVPEAEKFAQVWNTLTELMEQTDLILGDTEADAAEFGMLLEEGITDIKIGVIPDSTGALQVSPLPRAGMTGVPVQFILGCADGLFPKDHTDDGILNDEERAALSGPDCPVLNGTEFITQHERLLIYETLARPTKRLWLSYPMEGTGGLQKSALFKLVGDMIGKHTVLDVANMNKKMPVCRYDALARLTEGMSRRVSGGDISNDGMLGIIDSWFEREEPALRQRLLDASENRYETLLPKALARKLYGTHLNMSASRLETFNECPFGHFMKYGLGAEPREVYEESVTDLGTFYHDALNAFFRHVLKKKIDIRAIDDAIRDRIVSETLPDVIRNHNGQLLYEDPRSRAQLFLMEKTVRQSVAAVVRQLQAGGFTPMGSEVEFGRGKAFPPILLETDDGIIAELSGKIDRVDCAGEDGAVKRVVDYKINGKAFSFAEIREGLAMQLPLYLTALAGGTPKAGTTAGMYYMPIRIAPVDADKADSEEAVLKEITDAFKMSGLTLSNPEVLRLTDGAYGEASFKSSVIKSLETTKAGAFGARAIVADEEEFLRVLSAAKEKAAGTLKDMLGGNSEAFPAGDRCRYCDYRSVCRFDEKLPGCRRKKTSGKMKLDDFLKGEGVPEA